MPNYYASMIDLFEHYDKRVIRELSNDDNMPDGDLPKINRMLDSAAGQLESALYGAFQIPPMVAIGAISSGVAAGATSFTVAGVTAMPPGVYAGANLTVFADASSNPPEVVRVTSVSGTTVNVLASGSAGGFAFAHGAAQFGITPEILSHYVVAMAADHLFGRRPGRPEALDKEVERQESWLQEIISGRKSIPGISRAVVPTINYGCGDPCSIVGQFSRDLANQWP